MISYSVYKNIHLAGVLMVFLALGGLAVNSMNMDPIKLSWRKSIAITHGLGLFLSLLGGFGLLARLGITDGLPGWIYVKLGIWVFFAALIGVVARKPALAKPLWPVIIVLGALAAYLAGSKPF